MKHWSLVVLAALWLPAGGCSPEVVELAPVLRPVRAHVVSEGTGTRTRTFSGIARAGAESQLSFRVAGRIEKLPVRVGDRVEAGQLVAELDDTDYVLTVQQAQAGLTSASAQERVARANYERVGQLYENNNASRADLDASRAAFESAQAQVTSASKQRQLARSQLSYTKLRAPAAGAISKVPLEAGENVSAGTPVAVLTAGDDLEVSITIPESVIGSIHPGDQAVVVFGALSGREYQAVVSEVGVTANDSATTFPVTLRLTEPDATVRPGMAAETRFAFQRAPDAARFVLPTVAVGEDEEGRFVFLVEAIDDSRARVTRRPVTVGELTSDGLEVLSGVTSGDVVVTAGVRRLRDGTVVRRPPELNRAL